MEFEEVKARRRATRALPRASGILFSEAPVTLSLDSLAGQMVRAQGMSAAHAISACLVEP